MARILFLGHSAGRTGAPMLLLHFLRWLRQHTDWEPELILKTGGVLRADYEAVCPTLVLGQEQPRLVRRFRSLCTRLGLPARSEQAMWEAAIPASRREGGDLVYGNTAATSRELAWLAAAGRPTVLHLHELRNGLRLYVGEEIFRAALPSFHRIIAASESVATMLRTDFALEPRRVSVVHEFVPVEPAAAAVRANWRAEVRRELGVPGEVPVIGACGTMEWRKGADLFVQVADQARKRAGGQRLHFLWLGGDPTGGATEANLRADLRQLGIEAEVSLVGERPDPARYLAAFDLFLLTSREDPFPLAMLEAGALGLPVVCFEGSGGGPEFVGREAGVVVPYLDVGAMAQAVVALAADEALRRRLGEAAARRVATEFSVEAQAPRLAAIIREVLAQGSRQNP